MNKEKIYQDTKSWNPFVGCNFDCIYCKPSFQNLVAWIGRMKHCEPCQHYSPHEHPERLTRVPKDRAVFVCEDGDVAFANAGFMQKVFEAMRQDKREDRVWFLQSKNPSCFKKYLNLIPENTYLHTTLETNRDGGYEKISKAPKPSKRYNDFLSLNWDKKIVTVEPIMKFDFNIFAKQIESINPKAVFIGYNSHPQSVPLPEPSMDETLDLVFNLRTKGIKVLLKEMRKMAYRDFIVEPKSASYILNVVR